MQKISGARWPVDTMLLATIADSLRILVWMQTKDGQKGRNRPALFVEKMTGCARAERTDVFDSPEAFRAWRARMMGGEE